MTKLRRSIALLTLVTAASGALIGGLTGTASAAGGTPPWEPDPASAGGLLFFNSAGQEFTGGNVTDNPIAAYVEGTATIRTGDQKATLYGYLPKSGQQPSQFSGDQLSNSTTYNPVPSGGWPGALSGSTLPIVAGSLVSIQGLENELPNTDTSTTDGYGGMYVLRLLTTQSGEGGNTTYDSADIQVSGSTWSVVYPAITPTATSTSLATVQSSPQTYGASVQLDATVTPSAPGTVQFEENGADIGSPVTVTAGATTSTASITTSTLPVGSDTLEAVFAPAQFSDYSGSNAPTEPYTINAPPADPTSTALGVSPQTAAADTTVALTATVTDTNTDNTLGTGSGQVSFYDDGTATGGGVDSDSVLLGTTNVGAGGQATLNFSSFAEGTHNLVAEFVPTNSATYVTSTSSAVTFTATAPAATPDSQTVNVDIPAGSLTITTPYSPSNPFSLGTAVLNPAATTYSASGAFGSQSNPAEGVSITDTRAGDLPWTASVTATNFAGLNSTSINAENLSFTGVTPSYISGNALGTGSDLVQTTNITSAGDYGPSAGGSDGLGGGVPHEFATAATGIGSVYIYGVLTLVAPTSTPAGQYTSTLTFTVA